MKNMRFRLLFFVVTSALTTEATAPFKVEEIPAGIAQTMTGKSWKPGSPVLLQDLRYLTIAHWGFDGKIKEGHMVVHAKLAQEILVIFQELFLIGYQIEKMKLIDEYFREDVDENSVDEISMADNNSSSFCARYQTAGKAWSKHSYGIAFDINPLQNPFYKPSKNLVAPEKGRVFLDRSNIRQGMIQKGDACYNAFISRGYTWGGDWDLTDEKGRVDYQHFEKQIEEVID